MLSISPVNYSIYNQRPAASFKGEDVTGLLTQGDDALNSNNNEEALKLYKQAADKAPDDVNVLRKIAKAQFKLKDYASAEENFKKFLEKNPQDADCLIELGETQRQKGCYKDALDSFKKASEYDNGNDLAKRSIAETENNILSIYNPLKAKEEKNAQAAENLKKALDMTVKYMSGAFMSELKDVTVKFGKTETMGGTANIAQYENSKKCITVSDSYIYAAPQVIAAYLTHESIHASDKDSYTSVREEQDAYAVAAEFWSKNSDGIKDPEMDYAAGLYKESPDKLNKRVEEIYMMRDSSIAKTSPNHPKEAAAAPISGSSDNSASQPLKQYDVIA